MHAITNQIKDNINYVYIHGFLDGTNKYGRGVVPLNRLKKVGNANGIEYHQHHHWLVKDAPFSESLIKNALKEFKYLGHKGEGYTEFCKLDYFKACTLINETLEKNGQIIKSMEDIVLNNSSKEKLNKKAKKVIKHDFSDTKNLKEFILNKVLIRTQRRFSEKQEKNAFFSIERKINNLLEAFFGDTFEIYITGEEIEDFIKQRGMLKKKEPIENMDSYISLSVTNISFETAKEILNSIEFETKGTYWHSELMYIGANPSWINFSTSYTNFYDIRLLRQTEINFIYSYFSEYEMSKNDKYFVTNNSNERIRISELIEINPKAKELLFKELNYIDEVDIEEEFETYENFISVKDLYIKENYKFYNEVHLKYNNNWNDEYCEFYEIDRVALI